ncbi:MAG: response regulator transcription factor [Candidatus Moraniibacteriota bacterium]
MRILIVEDQESLAKMLKKGLEAEGFAVDYVLDGEKASNRIRAFRKDYDLIILDLMLPQKSGLEICQEMRQQKIATPVIMLTAQSEAEDIILGLNIGADDYLAKPFSFEVLLARIRAILRRPKNAITKELVAGKLTLDPQKRKVTADGKIINLTMKEFSLLEYLMRNPNVVLSREQILSNVWDFSYDSFANVVDVHITNIRKKIGEKNGKIIETIRSIGYRINSKN